jgi:glycosyltransferase involved in cell wall biosynthesis
MSNRTISVAIPTHNREALLYESFQHLVNDDRVSEIVVVDDHSEESVYKRVEMVLGRIPKIKLYRNTFNLDCYRNKHNAISYCDGDFAILLDSDNIVGKDYIDKIFEHSWEPDVILAPVFAYPQFDYREFEGLVVTKSNVASLMDRKMFSTALNTANYFVNKESYRDVFDYKQDPVTADSIFMAYQWLNAGKKIYFVPGMQYFHRVHPGSHYQNNVHRTGNFLSMVEHKLRSLT